MEIRGSQPGQRNHDQSPTRLAPFHGLWASHDRSWEAGEKRNKRESRSNRRGEGERKKKKILAQTSKATLRKVNPTKGHHNNQGMYSQKHMHSYPLLLSSQRRYGPDASGPISRLAPSPRTVHQLARVTSAARGRTTQEGGEAKKKPPLPCNQGWGEEGMDGMVVWQQT